MATYDLYRELGIIPQRMVRPVTTLEIVDEKGERKLELVTPLEDLERQMKRLSPEDEFLIEDLIDAATCIDVDAILDIHLSHPGEASSFWKARKFQQYLMGELGRTLREFASRFHDPFLEGAVASLAPESAPAWAGAVFLSMACSGSLGWLEGGSDSLISALCARLGKLGGGLEFDSKVDRVLVAGRSVTGVGLADGRTMAADAVISAMDGNETFFDLLDESFVDDRIRRWKDLPTSRPVLTVAIGTSVPLAGAWPQRTIILSEPIVTGADSSASMVIRHRGQGTYFAPMGKDLVQVELGSDWGYWYKLGSLYRLRYEREKNRLGMEVLARLEGMFPGISAKADMVEVTTPYDIYLRTSNHEGCSKGLAPSHRALDARPLRKLPKLEGLYVSGQWVEPGGGIATCLMSARQAVKLLCQDQDEEFRAGPPSPVLETALRR
jgi:phytoene dehydrogenase-like protein